MIFFVIAPAVIGMLPGIDLNLKLALVPILNLSLRVQGDAFRRLALELYRADLRVLLPLRRHRADAGGADVQPRRRDVPGLIFWGGCEPKAALSGRLSYFRKNPVQQG